MNCKTCEHEVKEHADTGCRHFERENIESQQLTPLGETITVLIPQRVYCECASLDYDELPINPEWIEQKIPYNEAHQSNYAYIKALEEKIDLLEQIVEQLVTRVML